MDITKVFEIILLQLPVIYNYITELNVNSLTLAKNDQRFFELYTISINSANYLTENLIKLIYLFISNISSYIIYDLKLLVNN